LFNLAQLEAPPKHSSSLATSTLIKMETSTSTKGSSHSHGLTQKQKDLLEALKDEPALQKAYLRKLMNDDNDSDDNDKAISSASTTKPTCNLQDSQDPYEF